MNTHHFPMLAGKHIISLMFFFMCICLQEAEWHCDEFTKGACFSRGKSEVSIMCKLPKHFTFLNSMCELCKEFLGGPIFLR